MNFLCKGIVPGRAFLRRLYAATQGHNLFPHHHIRISAEQRLDLWVWKQFLTSAYCFSRLFMDVSPMKADQIYMFSDASRNFRLGFSAYCGPEWIYGQWDELCSRAELSIEYLELFVLSVGVLKWIHLFSNKSIVLFCGNQAVVHMVNNSTSSCRNCMVLLRLITLECLVRNVRVYVKYVKSSDNGNADALSRLDLPHFKKLVGNTMNKKPSVIPQILWPISKIWLHN